MTGATAAIGDSSMYLFVEERVDQDNAASVLVRRAVWFELHHIVRLESSKIGDPVREIVLVAEA
jgi:hypothetical protein